ncbi:Solute carrier family 35 member C2-like [Oopsacas minuta]|uniref:Solute carrier family 35 member C2-like n=1 Tax=Oopsacas minuta TaxID=111878 RepID=A0AAV7JGT0_9METZ|nr:Solute carrier family 35 member C2-like [Oopsacas minuta]
MINKIFKLSHAHYSLMLQSLRVLGYILLYYFFSISLTFYCKWILTDFPFPLSATLFQILFTFLFCSIIRACIALYTKTPPIRVGGVAYIKNILPTSIAAAYDIGLSNWSFQFITVTLYIMCKTSAVIFVLFFAILFKLEKFRFKLIGIVLLICVGLFMFTFKYTFFNITGFILVISASVLSGIRWNTAQLLLQKSQLGLENPIDILYHVTPVISLCLFPLAVVFEGVGLSTSLVAFRASESGAAFFSLELILFSALLALGIGFSEFLLVQQTSSLTLSISGILKEVITLYIAITWFHPDENLSPLNVVGMCLCMLGILMHVWNKAIQYKTKDEVHSNNEETLQMAVLIREDELLKEEDYLVTLSGSDSMEY